MRTKYTLQELRAAGVETVNQCALFGKGPHRYSFQATDDGTVVIDVAKLAKTNPTAALQIGALLASLDSLENTPNAPAPVRVKSSQKNTALGSP